jgi:SAM-dependent methyltransferase
MHESVDRWVGEQVAQLDLDGRFILEVGSRDLNGSIRHHFPTSEEADNYLGVDIAPGDGVDLVLPDDTLDAVRFRSFGVVVSCETLEHARRPWLLCEQMIDRLAAGGVLLLTARGNGYPYHGEPYHEDWWRFMPGALSMLCRDYLGLADVEEIEDPQTEPPGGPGVFLRGHLP